MSEGKIQTLDGLVYTYTFSKPSLKLKNSTLGFVLKTKFFNLHLLLPQIKDFQLLPQIRSAI